MSEIGQASRFLPQGNFTGIGSLPMSDPEQAVAFVAEHSPHIPFWPQLPQRAPAETVIFQALTAFEDALQARGRLPGYELRADLIHRLAHRCDDAPAELDADCAAGFFAFERALAGGAFRDARALKGQIVGPITLATQMYMAGRPLLDARGPDLALALDIFRALAWRVTRLALWQIERLQRWGKPVILMLDEPCLSLAATHPGPLAHHVLPVLKESLTMIRAAGAVAGLHCCARLPTGLVWRARPDLISFDAHQGLEDFMADADMQQFIRQGGMVAFGLIPTAPDLSQHHALTLLSRWLESAMRFENVADLAERSLFTATCGLGLLNERAARQSFQLAGQVSSAVRHLLQRAGRLAAHTPVRPIAPARHYTTFHLWRRHTGA